MAVRVFEDECKTHMPFLFKQDGAEYLVFSAANELVTSEFQYDGLFLELPEFADLHRRTAVSYRPWKLYWSQWGANEKRRIYTGLTDLDVECSPCVSILNGALKLTFVGGIKKENYVAYHLYEMRGENLANLSPPRQLTDQFLFYGFETYKIRVTGDRSSRELRVKDLQSQETVIIEMPFTQIVRAIAIFGDDNTILITGIREGQADFSTWLYDLNHQAFLGELTCGGQNVYKSSLLGDKAIFAHRYEDDFENRHLHWTSDFEVKYDLPI